MRRPLQNRIYHWKRFFQKEITPIKIWLGVKYRITGSDGLEVLDAKFNGKYSIKSAKIVDWHVAYRGYRGGKIPHPSETVVAGRRLSM